MQLLLETPTMQRITLREAVKCVTRVSAACLTESVPLPLALLLPRHEQRALLWQAETGCSDGPEHPQSTKWRQGPAAASATEVSGLTA